MTSDLQVQQSLEPTPHSSQHKITWVGCDACSKWRKVSQAYAESLDEDKSWFCEQNPDPTFNSCDAPQELSDQEIDLDLARTNGHDAAQHKQQRPVVWQHVTENIFTHRSRKLENEDDIMVCQCRPPRDGSLGCGEACLNRMLNQECNPDFCPCGSQCSNTQFTKKQYADLEQRRAGPKGFGLFTKQDLKAGQFVIEYVGEVLEEEEYLRRKTFYQDIGQRHYYFMNIGNGEVIDACRKGALGRFINHSCDPNCETQKWVVHGELAIGLFALRDVRAGQELTFDYNFERYGDKALKCFCQSHCCRGYIGGLAEEQATDVEVDEYADASNDPEPIMVGTDDVSKNPACQAILANEVGLASADFQDDKLRTGWEELAAKYNIALDWEAVSKDVVLSAESAEESKALGGDPKISTATLEAVEQKLKESKAQRRSHGFLGSKIEPHGRRGKSSAIQSVMLHDGAAHSSTGGQVARQAHWSGAPSRSFRRRSEVDRRLENLVGGTGKLRETGMTSIIKMLRLFNLCDLGSNSYTGSTLAKADPAAASSRTVGVNRAQEEGVDLHGDSRRKKPRLDPESFSESSPDREKEDGEIDRRSPEGRPRAQRPAEEPDQRKHGDSREGTHLTPRQRARMADLSLLLEVILKTTATSTKQEFCKCGILRQLQSVMGRCTGPAYMVIIKKMLRAVEHLPLSPEDLHQHSSAHGSFFDTLFASGMYTDYEIRSRARALKERYPLEACSVEVQEAAKAARAAAQAKKIQNVRRRRSNWGSDAPDYPPAAVHPRFSRLSSNSARPRVSKFHGPEDTAVWESPLSSDSRPRRVSQWSDRESLRSDRTPANPRIQEALQTRAGSHTSPAPVPHMVHPWNSHTTSHQGPATATVWKGQARSDSLHGLHVNTQAMQQGSYPTLGTSPQTSLSPNKKPGWETKPISPSGLRQQGHNARRSNQYSVSNAPMTFSERRRDDQQRDHPPRDLQVQRGERMVSLPPPLPTEPPPKMPSPDMSSVSPSASPVSAGLPSVSPVTPNGASLLEPPSPPILSGAYMDDDEHARGQQTGLMSSQAAKVADDWKVPAWNIDTQGGTSVLQTKAAALAAPLPAPGATSDASNLKARDADKRAAPNNTGADHDSQNGMDEDLGSGSSPKDGVSSWDRPGPDFDAFVGRVITRRLGKYQQPDHPNHISKEDYKELFKKSRRAIIDAERKAYEERQRNRTFKYIERDKLEIRIRDYVRDLIKRLHDRKMVKQSNGTLL